MSGSGSGASPRKPKITLTGCLRALVPVEPALLNMCAISASATTRSASHAWLEKSWTGSSLARPVLVSRIVR